MITVGMSTTNGKDPHLGIVSTARNSATFPWAVHFQRPLAGTKTPKRRKWSNGFHGWHVAEGPWTQDGCLSKQQMDGVFFGGWPCPIMLLQTILCQKHPKATSVVETKSRAGCH